MAVLVGDRRIYVNTRDTQTVKICTRRNRQGQYEKYYRINPPLVLEPRQMELLISRFTSLADLERWLVNDRKAHRESQNEVGASPGAEPLVQPPPAVGEPQEEFAHEEETDESAEVGGAVAEILDLLKADKYSPDDDPWLHNAKDLVEQSIDRLLQEFIEYPYLHRREHSIHAQLFWIMMSHQELAERVPLGDDLAATQLVHKESVGREGNRRGNFDLAVLSPKLLRGCPSIKAFTEGRLQAPIVIEMGLDYDAEHLAGDAKKLINSKPTHGYLIHLVRELPRESAAEQIVLGIEAKFGIKTAYGWKASGQTAFKRVNDQTISEE
ncbi:MAG: hypothetical protein HY238_22885 [Acidobacteria bacterium]|nr:hypothetical protein [Acidobacteriota bacterium]